VTQTRLIALVGLAAWLIVGVPAFLYHFSPAAPPDARWTAGFLFFGLLFAADLVRPNLLLLAAESAAAIALILLRCNGYEGTLLALVAMQLGARVGKAVGILWIGAQTLLLGLAVASTLGPRAAWLLAPPYLGFQLVAFFTLYVFAREVAARRALAAVNAELRAAQEILAESSRIAERLRIARELHDALGHRLTVLTLNLEAARHRTEGPARASVDTAQSIARELLGEVREIVTDASAGDGIDLTLAMQSLVQAVPRPDIHLSIAPGLRVADPERAHILLRCAQEIVTNAARHSQAQNLWITIREDAETLKIEAHDDGRGRDVPVDGLGLRGMRERLERAGGELRIATQPGRGFGISARLPARSGVA
jgi:signal transduction histidine kinase